MAKNVGLFGRRELEAHRRLITGVTASLPAYKEVDTAGNKEWVVDVYIGPVDLVDLNIVQDCPIAPYAKELVTDLRQPVSMERSKQGKYTVVGRAKIIASGAQTPEETIADGTYHLVTHNLSDLKSLHIADVDWELEVLQADPSTELQSDIDEPLQAIDGFDAFGHQVVGEDADSPSAVFSPGAVQTPLTRHIRIALAKLGPKGDPGAMDWGVSILQPAVQELIEA